MKKDEKIIVKMIFGSHLYGTSTIDSDLDYKGIFLPNKEDIILGKVPKSYNFDTKTGSAQKNTSNDIDTEIYSLHYFIELALEGQTVAFDMLHANSNHIIESSGIWEEIVSERHRFYTRNLKSFIGYARRQAAKYGIKGSRLNAAQEIIDLLSNFDGNLRLRDIWNMLPSKEYLYFLEPNQNDIRQYQICGKIMQETQTINYTLNILKKFCKEYGARAKLAAENKGIDWKAISHAVRAAMQTKELLTKKIITFPLSDANLLLNIKKGKMDYIKEVVPILEKLMDEVKILSSKSDLPINPDRKYWENFIIETVCNHVL